MKGYDILRRYETGGDAGNGTADIGAPTTWAREAVGWTSAYEKITKKSIDADILQSPRNPMKFHGILSYFKESYGIQWNSMEFQRMLWDSKEFYGIP